jgi:hypothetical protein
MVSDAVCGCFRVAITHLEPSVTVARSLRDANIAPECLIGTFCRRRARMAWLMLEECLDAVVAKLFGGFLVAVIGRR